MNRRLTEKTLCAALTAVIVATAGCQRSTATTDREEEMRRCDSIIAHCRKEMESAASPNRCNGLSYELLEALEAKDSLLWLMLMERCAGDEKLFMYQQFEYDRALFVLLCNRNDSLVYHRDTEDPWWMVYSNGDKEDWLERHIRILQLHTRER